MNEPRGSRSLEDPFGALIHGHLVEAAATEDEDRVARIAEEALAAFRSLAHVKKAVSIFGSAQVEPVRRWRSLARETSAALARAGFAVITGGGPGLMSAANEGAEKIGGTSIGLTIHLPGQEEPNEHLSLHVPFHYFFLRKLAFVKYSCAFVCLPGGFGTLDELFEALNLQRTHKLHPFPVLLVGSEYWRGLRMWLADTVSEAGALPLEAVEQLEITDDPDEVVSRVRACHEEMCRLLGIHQ